MTTITVKRTTYTFLPHAELRMTQKGITLGMVKYTMERPDRYEEDRSHPENMVYIRTITGRQHPLLVAVHEESRMIVTVFWLEGR